MPGSNFQIQQHLSLSLPSPSPPNRKEKCLGIKVLLCQVKMGQVMYKWLGTWGHLLNNNLGKPTAMFRSNNDVLHNSEKIPLFLVPQLPIYKTTIMIQTPQGTLKFRKMQSKC